MKLKKLIELIPVGCSLLRQEKQFIFINFIGEHYLQSYNESLKTFLKRCLKYEGIKHKFSIKTPYNSFISGGVCSSKTENISEGEKRINNDSERSNEFLQYLNK